MQKIREWHYYRDKEGGLFHEGFKMEEPWLLCLLNEGLQKKEDGRLYAVCQGEVCYLTCEDTPYVVQGIEARKDSQGKLRSVLLNLGGGYTEPLNLSTLFVGKGDVLYCWVRGGQFIARFSRKSYYQLTPFVEKNAQGLFFIEHAGEKYFIYEKKSQDLPL